MAKHQAIVSVGSNIDPEQNIDRAIAIIRSEQELVAESTMIQTKPVGLSKQPDFINGALLINTGLEYESFNQYLKDVESRLQRDPDQKAFGPRTMDLDIIVWDGTVVHDDFYQYEHTRGPVGELIDKFGIEIESGD
jgi:2-amino-4-hydroxy-6-hydroxymethyldihydropteridine diphosphokinase